MRAAESVRVHDQASPLRCLGKGADQIRERLAAGNLHRGGVESALSCLAELAVDLPKHLIQMPAPLRIAAHVRDASPADLRGEHRAKPVPPEPDRLMADVDPAFGQQVLDVAQRQRISTYIITTGLAKSPVEWISIRFDLVRRRRSRDRDRQIDVLVLRDR